MRDIVKKRIKDERGAALIIEMSLIFPLVLLVMCFLLYVGFYILQGTIIYNTAQRIAVIAAREAALPGYEVFYDENNLPAQTDFNWPKATNAENVVTVIVPGKEKIDKFAAEHDPYRYVGNGFLAKSEADSLENSLRALVNKTSFLKESRLDCQITTKNNVINQTVHVRVIKYIDAPAFLQSLGVVDNINIDITATAIVADPAEFIRNTDTVFDVVDFICEDVKIGGSTINEKIAFYKQKLTDVAARLGIGW